MHRSVVVMKLAVSLTLIESKLSFVPVTDSPGVNAVAVLTALHPLANVDVSFCGDHPALTVCHAFEMPALID